ncbi:protein PAXX isoform X1 [Oncorhynchus kisutch]|uniref:PAXX non-homologous end joining factor n=1 Tax=Oncorhynchus kisutch TaxID=8019 RepID=A0A8C7HA66_ONCKI|nr:protein PAXX-like isoform X1 [Oncorhynchus kisutch]
MFPDHQLMPTLTQNMDGNLPLTQSSYCTVVDKKDQSKLICYTHTTSGIFNVGLTNAFDVWSTDFTEETLNQFRQKFALKSTEDYILKIRSACGSGSVSVSVEDTDAVLYVAASPGDLSVTLSRLKEQEAKEVLRELLFRMADSLTHLNNTAGPASFSPGKSPHKRNTDFEPRRHQQSGQTMAVKKRLPGDSLINPGTKRKRQATGVAFDEEDDQ